MTGKTRGKGGKQKKEWDEMEEKERKEMEQNSRAKKKKDGKGTSKNQEWLISLIHLCNKANLKFAHV